MSMDKGNSLIFSIKNPPLKADFILQLTVDWLGWFYTLSIQSTHIDTFPYSIIFKIVSDPVNNRLQKFNNRLIFIQ